MIPSTSWPGTGRYIAETLGISLLYIGTAKLGFLIAIPPGNVTILWPPSGIALAALMVFRYRACLGIALGALAVNVWNMPEAIPLLQNVSISLAIALGSTVQTAVAMHVLCGRSEPPLAFFELKHIVRFAGLSALCCIIAASIGVSSLAAGGLVLRAVFISVWQIWWLGDWIGMLVFAPLSLGICRWFTKQSRGMDETILIVWSAGIGISVFFFIMMWQLEAKTVSERFKADAQAVDTGIRETIQSATLHLDAITGLFNASETVTRNEFQKFVGTLTGCRTKIPGIQTLEWIPWVPAKARKQFEEEARRSGLPDFSFTEQGPEGKLQPAGERDAYYPVYFIQPIAGNEAARGFDLGSNPARLEAINVARQTGQDAATPPIPLVQEPKNTKKGVLIFRPIFLSPPSNCQTTSRDPDGFALAVIRASDLIDASLAKNIRIQHDVYVIDENAPAEHRLIYFHPNKPGALPLPVNDVLQPDMDQKMSMTQHIMVANRKWTIIHHLHSSLFGEHRTTQTWTALFAGFGLTILTILHIASRQREATILRYNNAELERLNAEIKAQQAHLIQSEKMSSIGQLAAGIAHEINNPAGFVAGNLDALRRFSTDLLHLVDQLDRMLPDTAREESAALKESIKLDFIRNDLPDLLNESAEGMERIGKIVANLREFSHVDTANQFQKYDLNELIDKTIHVAWNEIKYKCTIERDFGTLPPLLLNGGQISQVILNLLINAVQAIEKKGTITIKTRATLHTVTLSLTDDGPGIQPDVQSKVFDPFFTTKPVGKGTGLGLHICQKIIVGHGGTITVESDPPNGTTVVIILPIRDALTLEKESV